MRLTTLFALALSLASTVVASPLNIVVTKYNTIEVVETATATVTQVVQVTQYV